MKKSTVINKLEKHIDQSIEALYIVRDALEEVEDIELDELVNEIVEDLECDIADKVDQIRERLDIIFE
tara:strand:- start:679 stop:882 length:204 start_codon:yes stop_codon:yes gene_type:complete